MQSVSQAIHESLKWLRTQQQADGSFLSVSSPRLEAFSDQQALTYTTTFTQALILESLCVRSLSDSQSQKVRDHIVDKLASFLLKQKSAEWTFNYWPRHSAHNQTKPYPEDLDDTFCALVALWHYRPSLLSGEALAKIVTVLTTVEAAEGGPYRTWLVPTQAPTVWKDVDLAVNANIAYFLKLQEIDLPNVTQLFDEKIAGGLTHLSSPYYPHAIPLLYFLARAYQGPQSSTLAQLVTAALKTELKRSPTPSALNLSLLISAAINLKFPLKKLTPALTALLATRTTTGWPAAAFCLDPAVEGVKHYAGSATLTTAFAIEAMNGYLQVMEAEAHQTSPAAKAEQHLKQEARRLYQTIVKRAKQRFQQLESPLRDKALAQLTATLAHDHDQQIVLLPLFFRASLGDSDIELTDEMIVQLGAANLYGWMAYTIYDDFLDEEGAPEWLSVATVCLRE